jgi:uncharacterized membrane protein YphA (DoxX/SURF4 family)
VKHSVSWTFNAIDRRITAWMSWYGIIFLRFGLGTIFLWFGLLKFFPSLDPPGELALATKTVDTLSFGMVGPGLARVVLATWETAVGLGLLSNMFMRTTLFLLFVQMAGTVTPLVIFPGDTWQQFPFVMTLEGQYIVKNIVLVGAGFVIGAKVRGERFAEAVVRMRSLHSVPDNDE